MNAKQIEENWREPNNVKFQDIIEDILKNIYVSTTKFSQVNRATARIFKLIKIIDCIMKFYRS